jgi:hypothetical protein
MVKFLSGRNKNHRKMRSHFTISNPYTDQKISSTGKPMRSHFLMSNAAMVCALSGATAMVAGVCSGQIVAADYATNSAYAGGWSAGQNGGFGFGAWSFNATDPTPGGQQEITSSSPLGRSWTLFNLSSTNGISIGGRAINGGLQPGQKFETIIQNPVTYHFFRGWDIAFFNGTDNHPAGNNSASIALNIFGYTFTGSLPNWDVTDNSTTTTTLSPYTTGSAGMKLDLTLTSATTYSLTLTPLSNPGAAYTQSGSFSGGPIDWVQFRLYNTISSGPTDTASNFEINGMTISTIPEPSALLLLGLGSAGFLFRRRRT